jgi:hypothetical protein
MSRVLPIASFLIVEGKGERPFIPEHRELPVGFLDTAIALDAI